MSKFTFKGGEGTTCRQHIGCTYILSIVLDLALSWEGLGIIGSCVLEEKKTSR